MTSLINTRFPNGVTNVLDNDLFQAMPQPDPTKLYELDDDFFSYHASEWTVTETQAGATQALGAGVGSWLVLTNSAANNDLNMVQRTFALASFAAGKRAWFKARFKVDNANLAALVVGMQNINTAPLTATDGIYFTKAGGTTNLSVICRRNTTTGSTSAVVGTLADDTFVEVGWYYNGVDRVLFSLNGNVVGSLDGSSTFLPDANCSVVVAVANGSAVARTLTADYVYFGFER
ncbi:hypothetical protein [Caulobacter phage KcrB]|nr:hypothetical protein RW_GP084c [Caulobacter phage RW]WCA46388.1 hypothetical protein [Caulobacter phage KcrB]WCD56323.1 hypothetical protein [Caulobacter phage RLK]WNV48115.1 hypothetical protein GB2A_gp083c [Caulobacter phage GB2A]